jgi:hypothetical protein
MQKNLPESRPALAAVPPITRAILAGMQKYTYIRVPVLAIYALPHPAGQPFKNDAARAAADAQDEATTEAQGRLKSACLPRGWFDWSTRIVMCSCRMRRMC